MYFLDQHISSEKYDAFISINTHTNALQKAALREDYNLHGPSFYFALLPSDVNLNYWRKADANMRKWSTTLAWTGLAEEPATQVLHVLDSLNDNTMAWQGELLSIADWQKVYYSHDPNKLMDVLGKFGLNHTNMDARQSFVYPTIKWMGSDNRFHRFWKKIWTNTATGQAVQKSNWSKILRPASITLFIALISLGLALLLGALLGRKMYRAQAKFWTLLSQFFLFLADAIPLFWLATVLLILVSGTLGWTGLLHMPSLMHNEQASIFTYLRPANIGLLVLPILSILILSIPYVAIQVAQAMQAEDESKPVLFQNILGQNRKFVESTFISKKAKFTLLTIAGNALAGMLSGSLVIEYIFNIPGMGRLMWQSMQRADWSVVQLIVLISVALALVVQLLVDFYFIKYFPEFKSLTDDA